MSTVPSSLPALAPSRARPPSALSTWAGRAATAATAVVGLWLVFSIYAAGQSLVALGALALLGAGLYVYATRGTTAWRYLFPGVVGMLVFVAFPLLYTAQIGFTNYSSSHLLAEDRVRAYLLEQVEFDPDRTLPYALHRDGGGVRLELTTADGRRLATPRFTGARDDRAWELPLQPVPAGAAAGEPLSMRELLKHRPELLQLRLKTPEGGVLQYAGVREFGPTQPLWQDAGDGSLRRAADGKVFRPDHQAGWFQAGDGEHVQPGFKVNVGVANYVRMLEDREFRGPFFAIFAWTVVFAALTVVFSLSLGMLLAVLLNWESLKYRTLYRTLLFLPYAVPGFISILVFKGLFNQNFGEINAILDAVFGIRPAWFADPLLAKVMLLLVNTWLGYPYFLVLCTGLLKSIPADLYEASALAGASPWTNFTKITAPLIVKPLTPLMISAFAFNFNNFVLISLLTNGRPDFLNTKIPAGTTDILVSYTYRIAFLDSGQNFGLAAAISTVIFALVALMSLANLRFTAAGRDKR